MKKNYFSILLPLFICFFVCSFTAQSQIIISQYYEGNGTNKWIELTNTGTTAVNTASPQLKLGLWAASGTSGNIKFSGSATQTVNLTVTIPAQGSVLIGNTGNGTEVPYLTAASAVQTSNTVIAFDGNDGIALLNSSNTIIDRFGQGVNANNSSYVRNSNITSPSSTFSTSQWTVVSLTTVQTAVSTSPNRLGYHIIPACVAPSAQPTALLFNTITTTSINGSFSAAASADEYLVVRSTSSTLSAAPVDGTIYSAGNSLGGGTVVYRGNLTSFAATGLSSGTNYYFFVYSLKNVACSGGPKYLSANPLTGSAATPLPACVAPAAQASALTFSNVTSNSLSGAFTSSGANEYLVIQSTSSTLSSAPVNGTVYNAGNALAEGTVIKRSNTVTFAATGLNANTTYYYFVFALNNTACTGGPVYLTTNPLSGNQTTAYPPCVVPSSQPTALNFSSVTTSSMNGGFTSSGADEYLVVISNSASLTESPVDGTVYNAGTTFGGGTIIQRSAALNFSLAGLTASTTYYVFIFSLNSNCTGGPVYLIANPLTGSQATAAEVSNVLNFYNGNLHSHSSYSDGNSDNVAKIPADDYAFAKTALCMDFLGISEHNHATAGMHLADWQPGITQAAAATTPNFVALHGMEWGIIGTQGSAGDHAGHVVVYGVDSLIGWEANNYQIYVPKSTYTGTGGLFEIINRHGNNAFAYCAHPDNYDYDNLLNIAYDINADNALVGSAVESGPAFSTDTTYTNPAASMAYYAFYKNMLAKGYHVGPVIDHDNHNLTFGHTAKSRLVILANSLTENNLLDAMRRMRFYASEDCGAKISFTINTPPLGSVLRQTGAPVISVNTITTAAVSSIKLMYGVPGSGTAATTLTSTTTGTLNYTHTALSNLATGYYFADITETNGQRIITAPIWYTRDDAAARPAAVTSLYTVNETDRVTLKWITGNETTGQQFEIERSADNRNFTALGMVTGNGVNVYNNNYALTDMYPANGMSYYRLLQKDANGKILFSETKVVNRGTKPAAYLTVYPNPVQGMLAVRIAATQNETTYAELYDMAGRKVLNQQINLLNREQSFQLNMYKLNSGTYILKIKLSNQLLTTMVNKL